MVLAVWRLEAGSTDMVLLAIPKFSRDLGRVTIFNQSII